MVCRLKSGSDMEAANNAIDSDVQKRRFALLLHTGYGKRWAPGQKLVDDLKSNLQCRIHA
jgi:hypothetical protein